LGCFEEFVEAFYVSTERFDVFCFGETDKSYCENEEHGEDFAFGGDGWV